MQVHMKDQSGKVRYILTLPQTGTLWDLKTWVDLIKKHSVHQLNAYGKIIGDRSGSRGMTTVQERYDVCAGERCMAYRVPNYGLGESGPPTCKRLEPNR